ncbi:MAG: hypothetical protein ACREDT_14545 [Methylocella sp.]
MRTSREDFSEHRYNSFGVTGRIVPQDTITRHAHVLNGLDL